MEPVPAPAPTNEVIVGLQSLFTALEERRRDHSPFKMLLYPIRGLEPPTVDQMQREQIESAERLSRDHARTLRLLGCEIIPCIDMAILRGPPPLTVIDVEALEAALKTVQRVHLADDTVRARLTELIDLVDKQFAALPNVAPQEILDRYLADTGEFSVVTECQPLGEEVKRLFEQFRRLGFDERNCKEFQSLTNHMRHRDEGTLFEYVVLHMDHGKYSTRLGEGFNPGVWHTDSTPAQYSVWWDKALLVLRCINRSEVAHDMAMDFREHLLSCIQFAREALQGDDLAAHLSGDASRQMLEKLDAVSEELLDIW